MLNLPPIWPPRGSIEYPKVEIPEWLDSDPYRERWWLHDDLRAKREAKAKETTDTVYASGGFCAPAMPIYDFFQVPAPLTERQKLERRAKDLAYYTSWRGRRDRLVDWWNRHWWPTRIRELEARLDGWED